jgi:hypothetical protein
VANRQKARENGKKLITMINKYIRKKAKSRRGRREE